MKTSVIRYRVADFLKQYAPFNELSEEGTTGLGSQRSGVVSRVRRIHLP